MGFVRTADPGPNLEANLFRNGDNEYIVLLPVGYDEDSGNTISILVALSIQPSGDYEHIFCIVEADWDSGADYNYWDGLNTRTKIENPADRTIVLDLIREATRALLSTINIERIVHCTHTADLPEKALLKHLALMDTFRECGYTVTEGEPYHGQRIWLMQRVA